MALPHHHLLLQQQQMCNNPIGNLYNLAVDQNQHPPYIPPFHVVGFAPVNEGGGAGDEFQMNYGFEPRRKRLKEQDFLDNNNNNNNNNSQFSSIDFLQARSVSTGLGLSLDNGRLASSGDSSFLGIVGDEIDIEFQRQDAEIDKFLKVQGDRLRQGLLEKLQAKQLETISYVEERVLQKLHEKESELININRKNMELELRIEQLDLEANNWQQRAKQNEETINALKYNLEQIYIQNRDTMEGCGDSEVDDSASCCNGRALDFQLLFKEKEVSMRCKVCGVNRVSMLLLPCKHLCVCKECESKVSQCPLCHSLKYMGLEVYM